jgi:DNA-binding NtrC family response regulator
MAVSKNIETVSPEAMARLMRHDYPGNIRELENIIEYAAILCQGQTIELCHLPEHLRGEAGACPSRLGRTMAEIRFQAASDAVDRHGGNRNAACRELGISKDTLRRILGRRDADD